MIASLTKIARFCTRGQRESRNFEKIRGGQTKALVQFDHKLPGENRIALHILIK